MTVSVCTYTYKTVVRRTHLQSRRRRRRLSSKDVNYELDECPTTAWRARRCTSVGTIKRISLLWAVRAADDGAARPCVYTIYNIYYIIRTVIQFRRQNIIIIIITTTTATATMLNNK